MRYLITFACYGAHLHGGASGSVDRRHKQFGSRLLEANPQRESAETSSMQQAPYALDQEARSAVLEALREVCLHRGWGLLAAHVRTNHVHVILEPRLALPPILRWLKGRTGRKANQILGRKGQPFWQDESYDHISYCTSL